MSTLRSRSEFEQQLLEQANRAAGAWAEGCRVERIESLAGGYSSLTFRAELSGQREGIGSVVLKVAPPGLPAVRNRDVLRQARVMEALSGVPGLPLPAVYFQQPERPPTPPFFAMELVEGRAWEPLLDDVPPPPPAEVNHGARDATRVLASLHSADADAVGLASEPVIGLEAEIARWSKALATVEEDLRPGVEECAAELRSSAPPELPAAIQHGDYRLGNAIVSGGEVRAVIDWEIAGRGDPRVDLAWFLGNCEAAPERRLMASDVPVPAGLPDITELLGEYEAAAGVEVADIDWFLALTWFRSAATLALIVKHSRKRGNSSQGHERFAEAPARLIAMARRRLG